MIIPLKVTVFVQNKNCLLYEHYRNIDLQKWHSKPHFDYDSAANLLHPAASPLSTLKKEPASDCTLKVML